jgi:hypothetical protein
VTLARILLKLWRLRLWVGLGVLLAGASAVASVTMSRSTVYATASTQMLVDSPNSSLANASVDLTGYIDRAGVFARMMTSAAALQYIGQAAGINGNLIDATGPIEINGSPTATHAAVDVVRGQDLSAPATYQLSLVQNPSLPTVDVYATAPTTAKAVALADGAVTGFAKFVGQLNANQVPQGQRVEVRQLGEASGGVVDPSASKSIAILVFVGVFAVWCCLVLFTSRLLADVRAAKRAGVDDLFAGPEHTLPTVATPSVADDRPRTAPAAGARGTNGRAGVSARPVGRAKKTFRAQSRS